jgi:hypothetical protein
MPISVTDKALSARAGKRDRPTASGPWLWFLSLSGMARAAVVGGLLVGALLVFFSEENWRGKRAWETARQTLIAKGVELDWQKFIPPPVPDAQNFAATPFLAPLFDFPRPHELVPAPWRDPVAFERAKNFGASLLPMNKKGQVSPALFNGKVTDLSAALQLFRNETNGTATTEPLPATRADAAVAVLAALKEYQPVLTELRLASARPYSRFDIEYDAKDPMTIRLPHYLVLHHLTKVLDVEASAEIALGKTEEAFADIKLMEHLADAIRDEPFLIGWQARGTLIKAAEQIIWEGLAVRGWSEPQLVEFQSRLRDVRLLRHFEQCLKGERASFGETAFDLLHRNKNALRDWMGWNEAASSIGYLLAAPEGWLYQEQVTWHRLYDEYVWPGFDPEAATFQPHLLEANRKALEAQLKGSPVFHHTGVSRLSLHNISNLFPRAAISQNRIDQTILACALERCRLANGKYPKTLAALSPRFTEKIPADVCNGEPMKYRMLPDGQFVLYSIGWNEKDDGGVTILNKDESDFDPDRGDWVWPAYQIN